MKVTAIKTGIYTKHDELSKFIFKYIKATVKPKSIIAVTSKLLSISQDLYVNKDSIDKIELIKKEAHAYICKGNYGHHLTLKNSLIMPTAGIDQSNTNNKYLLLPKNIHSSTKKLHSQLSTLLGFDDWGLIVTDSKSTPLRLGVSGFSLSYYGIQGVEDIRGKEDLFKNKIKITKINKVDPIAAITVLLMGEKNEMTPIAVVQSVPVQFIKEDIPSLYLSPSEDIYAPLYKDKL